MSDKYDYVIVGRENCPWCDLAKEKLFEANKTFKYIDLSHMGWQLSTGYTHLLKHELGMETVPVVFKVVGDYSDLKEHLENV